MSEKLTTYYTDDVSISWTPFGMTWGFSVRLSEKEAAGGQSRLHTSLGMSLSFANTFHKVLGEQLVAIRKQAAIAEAKAQVKDDKTLLEMPAGVLPS